MSNEAVSNIIGAFILVLIVVSAATGFAIYISETQQNTIEMGSSMMEYGLEELTITSTYDSLTFENETYTGVGLLFSNPGIRDIKVQGILIDGKYISKDTQHLYALIEDMVLYNFSYNKSYKGFKADALRNTSGSWWNITKNVSGSYEKINRSFILPQSSITRIIFTDEFLNDFVEDLSLPTHTLEVISARGRYFTATFAYP